MQPVANPVEFVTDGSSFTFNVNIDGATYEPITLRRALRGNRATYDISAYLKSFFKDQKEIVSTWLFPDKRLFVMYSVGGTRRSAINAAQRKGETVDLVNSSTDCVLTLRPRTNNKITISVYTGFPIGVCFAYRAAYGSAGITVTRLSRAGAASSIVIPNTSYNIYTTEFTPLAIPADVDVISVRGGSPGAALDVEFEDTCTPEYPVYVRWINRIGGYEYYMFQGYKTYIQDVKRGDTYTFSRSGDVTGSPFIGELQPDVEDTISCGAEQLSIDEFELLKSITSSPSIELFDVSRDVFDRVILKDSRIEWGTSNSRGVISMELILPKQLTQF